MSQRCSHTVAEAERYARDSRDSRVAIFAAHLDECERCQRRVDRLNEELANAVATLPEMAPPAELRVALLAATKSPNASSDPVAHVPPMGRVGRVVAPSGESAPTTRTTPGWKGAKWVAVAAALIIGLGAGWVAHPSQAPTVSEYPVALPAGASLSFVSLGKHHIAGSASFVTATDQHPAYLVLLGVTPPAAGKIYTLWYLTPNGKTTKAADVTSVTRPGVYTVENPPPNLTGMAISVESQPHEVAPTGPLVFATD